MHLMLTLFAICAITLCACQPQRREYSSDRAREDEATRYGVRSYRDEARSDFEIQELKYKPHDTYSQNTGKGRRVPNEQRSRNYRVPQQSGSSEALNGIYREANWSK